MGAQLFPSISQTLPRIQGVHHLSHPREQNHGLSLIGLNQPPPRVHPGSRFTPPHLNHRGPINFLLFTPPVALRARLVKCTRFVHDLGERHCGPPVYCRVCCIPPFFLAKSLLTAHFRHVTQILPAIALNNYIVDGWKCRISYGSSLFC